MILSHVIQVAKMHSVKKFQLSLEDKIHITTEEENNEQQYNDVL